MTGDMQQQEWGGEDLSSQEKTVKQFKKMFVEKFDEHCYPGLYTLKNDLLDNLVEDIRRFGSPLVLESCTYDHVTVHIKQVYKRA